MRNMHIILRRFTAGTYYTSKMASVTDVERMTPLLPHLYLTQAKYS